MTRDKNDPLRPTGHVWVPSATIAGLSMVLAGGLQLLGWLQRLNAEIARLVAPASNDFFPKALPAWAFWLAAVGFALGLALAILGSAGHARRAILWISTLVMVTAWAPVLGLAARAPDIAAPWIATLWSGACAMVYASHHRMACDSMSNRTPDDPR